MESSLVASEPDGGASQEKTRVEDKSESEYDSAGSYSDQEGRGGDSEGSVGRRESGDGQESVPSKRVDDDEDKKNPQYIPKRGTFYEHDDRTVEDEAAENPAEIEKDKDPKKKIWADKKERWSHDRFNDSEQAPKSRSELIAIYGYDIRNEDGPPRARRRRRYGRGPNKYTRNWEDEEAYTKPPPPRPKKPVRKSPRRDQEDGDTENFPPLHEDEPAVEQQKSEEEKWNEEKNEKNLSPVEPPPPPPPQEPQRPPQRVGSGRVVKPKREIKDSDYRGFTAKTRQVRNMRTDQKIVPKAQKREETAHTQAGSNRNNVQELEGEVAKMSIQDGGRGSKHGGQRQGSVPPRLQSEQKGSKRYSSIRQRSLPEAATPPFSQQANYYPNEYQAPIHQNTPMHPSPPQVPQIAPPPLPPIPQVPVTATPILQAPQFAPPFAQAPFLQPAPPPFIPPQQPPPIINYVASQPQFPQGYQGYQQPFNPVTQPEIYQSQTGITYYSTDQQLNQRTVPLKRPKAAIPIVAPPPIDLKGKMKEDDMSSYEGDISEEQTADSGGSLQDVSVGKQ